MDDDPLLCDRTLVGACASSVSVEEDDRKLLATTTTTGKPPPSWSSVHETIQSLYPGIQDYDALLRQQMRYRFQEHEFLPLQWKAMQLAGWSRGARARARCAHPKEQPGGGWGYVSPGGTRVWVQALELRQWLDRPAVQKVSSNLLKPPPAGDERKDDDDDDDDDDGKESIRDLRNAIIYQMQKLIEESKRRNQSNPSSENDDSRERHSSNKANNDDGEPATLREDTRPRRSSRHASTAAATATKNSSPSTKSVTATEKGTDLYLHRNSKKGRKGTKFSSALSSSSSLSSHTDMNIEDLSFPTLEECQERMAQMDMTACDQIESYYRTKCFASWRHLLSTNHSLLFYGNGSKHTLLSDFCQNELRKEGYAVQIDGFHPEVTIDGIFDLLVNLFLDGVEPAVPVNLFFRQTSEETGVFGDIPDNDDDNHVGDDNSHRRRAVAVARALVQHCATTLRQPIFLVVHSLDGLRTDRAQESLATLVQHGVVPGSGVAAIRLVASIDHVDAGAALWSGRRCADVRHKFRWIWKPVHTYRPYTAELALRRGTDDELCLMGAGRGKGKHKKRSRAIQQEAVAVNVLKNLAPKYSEVMQILARLQLAMMKGLSKDDDQETWVEFASHFRECKNQFVVDKENQLRALLSELKDHRLIVSKTARSIEYVRVPYSVEKLKEILAYQRGNQ